MMLPRELQQKIQLEEEDMLWEQKTLQREILLTQNDQTAFIHSFSNIYSAFTVMTVWSIM